MVWIIARREFLSNVITLRFLIGFILCLTLMVSSTCVLIDEYAARIKAYDDSVTKHIDAMKGTKVFSKLSVMIDRPPSKLSFLCVGSDRKMGNVTEAKYNVVPVKSIGGGRGNPLMIVFPALDMILIIQVVLGLLVLLFAYNTISGERERGTLAQALSNSVPRHQFLLGKFTGGMMSVAFPLLVGLLASLIVVWFSGHVNLSAGDWIRLGLAVITSFLLSWAMLAIVIPGVGGIIASRAVNVPSVEQNIAEASRAWGQAKDEYRARHRNAIVFRSSRWSPGENLAGPLAAYEAQNSVGEQYMDTMVRQVEVGQNTTKISPLGLYRHATEALAGTGIGHYESFMKQVRQYREFLRSVLLDKYPLDPHKHYGRGKEFMDAMSKVSFGLSDIPEFREDPISVEEGAKAAIWDIFFLSLFALLFFMGGVVTFLRYDVR